jgi:hypothetical protein
MNIVIKHLKHLQMHALANFASPWEFEFKYIIVETLGNLLDLQWDHLHSTPYVDSLNTSCTLTKLGA